ncbi:MAG: nicotinamide riboside transporter PnuC [Steroidobacteraceae bacterium]
MIDQLLESARHTTPLEALGVALGFVYVVLIIYRRRSGWIAGAASSFIYVYLSLQAKLPMQAMLQVFYVIMAAYGWWTWGRNQREEGGRIKRWPWWAHVAGWTVVGLVSAATARWLGANTNDGWPLLDSLTTWTSVLATWMVARSLLENWFYWMVGDSISVFLFASQGLVTTSVLFLSYLVMAVLGYRSWLKLQRAQAQASA